MKHTLVAVVILILASGCDTLMPPGVLGPDGKISPCNGHHMNPQDCGYAMHNAPLLPKLQLGMTRAAVREIMKHDAERKEARLEGDTEIENWRYMANYENELMVQLTFVSDKLTEIKQVPWRDED